MQLHLERERVCVCACARVRVRVRASSRRRVANGWQVHAYLTMNCPENSIEREREREKVVSPRTQRRRVGIVPTLGTYLRYTKTPQHCKLKETLNLSTVYLPRQPNNSGTTRPNSPRLGTRSIPRFSTTTYHNILAVGLVAIIFSSTMIHS